MLTIDTVRAEHPFMTLSFTQCIFIEEVFVNNWYINIIAVINGVLEERMFLYIVSEKLKGKFDWML